MQPAKMPDRLGVVAGFRVWRVLFDKKSNPPLVMKPMSAIAGKDVVWKAGLNVAQCSLYQHLSYDDDTDDERVPAYGCTCGFHSYYNLGSLPGALPSSMRLTLRGVTVNWGEIVHHDTFFRAQYAAPVAVYIPGDDWALRVVGEYIPDRIRVINDIEELIKLKLEVEQWEMLPYHLSY